MSYDQAIAFELTASNLSAHPDETKSTRTGRLMPDDRRKAPAPFFGPALFRLENDASRAIISTEVRDVTAARSLSSRLASRA